MTESTQTNDFFPKQRKMRKQKENVEVGEFECLYVHAQVGRDCLGEGASAFVAVGLKCFKLQNIILCIA